MNQSIFLGLVSQKNEVNIMVKNAVDVIYGGLSYWLYGFAFSFGTAEGTNGFSGIGEYFCRGLRQMKLVTSTCKLNACSYVVNFIC